MSNNGFRLDAFVGKGIDEYFPEMVILGLAVSAVVINAVVDRVMLLAVAVHQVYHPNALHQTAFRAVIRLRFRKLLTTS